MLFNSLEYFLFLPLAFCLYWFVFNKYLRLQNALIVILSYVFYGWWDWRFLFLIFFSTVIDYSLGLFLEKEISLERRKLLLWLSLLVNLGILGVFKYYNFFIENIIEVFSIKGIHLNLLTIKIILPVGISFYTFQTLSYTIDIYNKRINATKDFIAFAAFVSFFPQLVAGPIERAKNLVPQFLKDRKFNHLLAADGAMQILWGLFMKIVIADNCAYFANMIFNNSDNYSGSTLVIGAIMFTFQIYGDFAGYSNIAIGTSKLFGFNLMQNFAFPYFSRDIAEFWRRWHISLSTWFRDYLYIPLGGSKGTISKKVRNIFIIFVVSGFWHGANWTFIAWGAINALYFIPLLLTNRNRFNLKIVAQGKIWPTLKEATSMLITFGLTVIGWIFFRADSISHAGSYLTKILSKSLFSIPDFEGMKRGLLVIILIIIFTAIEWFGRDGQYGLSFIRRFKRKTLVFSTQFLIIVMILLFGNFEKNQFIYFQF